MSLMIKSPDRTKKCEVYYGLWGYLAHKRLPPPPGTTMKCEEVRGGRP